MIQTQDRERDGEKNSDPSIGRRKKARTTVSSDDSDRTLLAQRPYDTNVPSMATCFARSFVAAVAAVAAGREQVCRGVVQNQASGHTR